MTEKETPQERNEDMASLPVEVSGEAIYWAPAKSYQLANFIPEKKDMMGGIQQSEVPLRFTENIFITDKKEVMEFIEGHSSYKNGIIKKCATVAEAQALTMQQRGMKEVREVKCETIEKSTYAPKGEGFEVVKTEEVVSTK